MRQNNSYFTNALKKKNASQLIKKKSNYNYNFY